MFLVDRGSHGHFHSGFNSYFSFLNSTSDDVTKSFLVLFALLLSSLLKCPFTYPPYHFVIGLLKIEI